MECKRHRWRVGSGIGGVRNNKIVTLGLNIWCEKCNKKIKAKYSPYSLSIEGLRLKRRKVKRT